MVENLLDELESVIFMAAYRRQKRTINKISAVCAIPLAIAAIVFMQHKSFIGVQAACISQMCSQASLLVWRLLLRRRTLAKLENYDKMYVLKKRQESAS